MRDIANVMVGSILLHGKYFHYKSSGCCDGNKIITSEISDVRDEMINFYSSDCDENQSEISDSSDFIVFPNIKWISS